MLAFFIHKLNGKDYGRPMYAGWKTKPVAGAILLLLAVVSEARTNAPLVHCEAPLFDFGLHNNDEEVIHAFTLTNAGDAALVVSQIRSGCGCTRAELDRSVIPPGGSATLSSRLSLRGHIGPKQTTIYLHTNDPDHPVFLCQFKGVAYADLEITPPNLCLEIPPGASNATASVGLLNRTATALRPLAIESAGPFASLVLATNQPGHQYTLTAACTNTAALQTMAGIITLLTDHPRFPKIEVPYTLSLLKDLTVYPTELILKEGAPDAMLESRYIILQSRNNQPFSVKRVEVVPATIAVGIQTAKPSWTRLKAGPFRASQSMNGTVIRIFTDFPAEPMVVIPVRVLGSAVTP